MLELIEYTDPYCTWCWGSEPVLRKIQEAYEDAVTIRFVMGGLVADIRQFYDPLNNIGGKDWYKQVAAHWLDASRRHGMPVDEGVWYDIKDDFASTYPANIAYKSAQMQDEALANRFLRRLREAASAQRMAIHRLDVQAILAEETGLDRGRFTKDIQSGKAEGAFKHDLRECRSRGVTGFPAFLIKNPEGRELMLHGYQRFDMFERALGEISSATVKPKRIEASEENIQNFILKYGKVAPKEVAEVFDLNMESSVNRLERLRGTGKVSEQKAGNGFFYLAR